MRKKGSKKEKWRIEETTVASWDQNWRGSCLSQAEIQTRKFLDLSSLKFRQRQFWTERKKETHAEGKEKVCRNERFLR